MRVIRIFPVLVILTATVLVASLFAFSAVGSVDATHLPKEELQAITLLLKRVDIVHTTDLAVKGVVINVIELESPAAVNFLDLQDGVLTALGNPDIDDGFVTQIRLVTTDASITFDSEVFSLKIPSGVLKLNGILIVPDDTDAVFDFDVEKSVKSNKGQGCCKLKPVLKFETI